MYLTDNWRAFRTWEVSAISPWEHGIYWKPRAGVAKGRKELKVDWENLQRPGFSPDYIEARYERMDMAYERSDWIPTAAAQALLRNNMPLLAYIGGKPARFTSKDHNFQAGETIEKQLIVINNSRETVSAECDWSFGLPRAMAGGQKISVQTGEQARIPLRFTLPAKLVPGTYNLNITVKYNKGGSQKDSFVVHVMPKMPSITANKKIALFDPREVPRLWRCGNRGNVASVLIEKPAVGDFLPIVDGGFSLQYSPLMEYREGKGMLLFCQMKKRQRRFCRLMSQ
jgi:beta-galactosidase